MGSLQLIKEFSNLVAAFEEEKIQYALCGGMAMAVYAFPRATMDIDVLIEAETLQKVKSIAERLGFIFDIGLMEFANGEIQIYRLTKIPENSLEPLMLDILFVTKSIQDVWESKQLVSWEEGNIPVVSPQGLIKLKSIRSSGQDLDDIEKLKGLMNEGIVNGGIENDES